MKPGSDIIRQISRRWLLLDCASEFLQWLAFAVLLWGCLLLTVRIAAMTEVFRPGWLMVGLGLIAGVMAVHRAWRRRPKDAALRAWLDDRHGLGGLFMLAGERDLGSWSGRLAPEVHARFRWRPGKPLLALAGALVFSGLCGWIPIHRHAPEGGQSLAIHRLLDGFEARLDDLERLELLDQATLDTFRGDLAKLAQEAQAGAQNPEQIWRTLDEWERNLGARVAAETAALAESLRTQKSMEDLAHRVAEQVTFLDEATQQQAMSGLHALFSEMAPETLQQLQELSNQLPATLSPKAAENLARLLAMSRESRQGLLEHQASSQAMSEAQLMDLRDFLERDLSDEQLKDFLDQSNMAAEQRTALFQCLNNGRPGEDGGSAPLTWKDEDILEEGPFQAQVLPTGKARMEDTLLLGERRGAPGEDEPGTATYDGLTHAAAGSGLARTQALLPKHRGAIGRYFDNEKNKPSVRPNQ